MGRLPVTDTKDANICQFNVSDLLGGENYLVSTDQSWEVHKNAAEKARKEPDRLICTSSEDKKVRDQNSDFRK